LKQDFLDGILVIKVPSAPFGPKIIEEEAPQDVERLTTVSETTLVIAMEVRWVVFIFKDGLPQEHGGLGDVEAVGGFPFVPYTKEGVPSLLSRGAFHQAVLSRLQKSLVAPLASGLNTHDLKRQVPTGSVATLTWPSVGVKPNTWKSWGFGALWDSRMFRARQKDPKHLALGCFWCHWKGLET
jgi:hypothetical protein